MIAGLELVREAATIVERQAVIEFLEALAHDKEKYCLDYAADTLREAAGAIRGEEHRRVVVSDLPESQPARQERQDFSPPDWS